MSPPLEMRMSNRDLLFSLACQQEANIAKEWLDGTGPSTVLDKADRWEKNDRGFWSAVTCHSFGASDMA